MLRKSFFIAFIIVCAFFFFFWYLVAHSFYDITRDKQHPFTKDQCTLLSDTSWQVCCELHDRAYWQGGTKEKRLLSDKAFRDCLYKETHNRLLSMTLYGVVRVGGMPYFALPWRWGYGWTFGRGYR